MFYFVQGLEFPSLKHRLGITLWHSGDKGGQPHLYCVYPKSSATILNRSGEYILKRADSFLDCRFWFTMLIFNEPEGVTEKDKIWWNEEEFLNNFSSKAIILEIKDKTR